VDLHGYVQAVRKYWWLVLLVTGLCVGASIVLTYTATPQYESSVTFFVSTPPTADGTALQADQYAQRRVNSYVGLLTSEKLAQSVIDTAHLDMTVSEVTGSIAAAADLNTVLLTATVTNSSPEQSLAITTAISTQFGQMVAQLDNHGSPESANVVLNVVSGPTLNPVPVSPRKSLNIGLGVLLGLALGLASAILREVLDNTVRSPQVLRTLSDAPVLGVIAADRGSKKSPLIVDNHARSVRAEAFRQLRTNLQFIDATRPVGVLVVTSSIAGEGKSTTAINLAVSFSDSGRRVLLIEADLRRPRVAEYLGLEGAVGLTNVLVGQAAIDDVLQPWGRGGLTVLPSGTIPPNPSELMGSPLMAELIIQLRKSFDMIIIDTPPLLPVTDAAVASRLADGVVVVVRYGKTTRNQVSTALRSLAAVDARVLGTVLTMSPVKGAEAYSAYGYYDDDDRVDLGPELPAEIEAGESGSAKPTKSAAKSGKPSRRTGLRRPRPSTRIGERDSEEPVSTNGSSTNGTSTNGASAHGSTEQPNASSADADARGASTGSIS
jgi:capsular exopolysaccharide synthesis family protein